ETVFFSKDPEVKSGLVDTIRSQAIARSKEKSVGDLAATMREAVLWTERGRNVTEEDLNAMLEGREDISEVQDNPFADMIAEADAAEGAMAQPPADGQAPANGEPAVTEQTPVSGDAAVSAPANDNAAVPAEHANIAATDEATTVPEQDITVSADIAEDAPVLSRSSIPDFGTNDDDDTEERAHTFEPVDEPADEIVDEIADNSEDNFEEADDSSNEELVKDEPAESASSENTFQGLNEQAVQQMSDEEFAAFMQKAQAFYNNANSTTEPVAPAPAPSVQKEEPEEDRYSSYSFGNEMTDEEYIAYLNRSARASRKEEPKPAASTPSAAPEKPKKKSFMPEDDEGGMTDEEYQAYLAEHGNDDDDDEGPVVYGAGKD
ncbi:MAG: chromosome segregation protein ScpA, partial [Fibrobacter sp.]|nr:chromosome segregation protein ScpA [Fibrobacter sp.]